MENKILENEFMHNLSIATSSFIRNTLNKKKELIKDKNKTELELTLFFLVRIAHTLKENFSKEEYNDILSYYHEKIINKKIEKIDNINKTAFLNERFEFHNNGIIELNQQNYTNDFFPAFDCYTTLLESIIFDYPLKKIIDIKKEVKSNFFDPFSLLKKHTSSLDLIIFTNDHISKVFLLSIETNKNKWNVNYKPIKFRYLIMFVTIISSLIYYFLIR